MYVEFTPEQRERARTADIAAFLQQRGETVKKSGSEKVWVCGTERITIRGNIWYNQYERVGGDAVDFVRSFYKEDYVGAVKLLLGLDSGMAATPTAKIVKKEKKELELKLPPRSTSMSNAYSYLRRRGISAPVLDVFVRCGMIYETPVYNNVVFVGFDPQGISRHANLRGTRRGSTFKGNASGCDPRYSFHWRGADNTLYLFEAPIDMLSYITMHPDNWRAHSYAAACGVSECVMWEMLQQQPNLDMVYLCRDTDQKGREYNLRTADALTKKNIGWEILKPKNKDWNEDLQQLQAEMLTRASATDAKEE